jgi:hypothetical protein
MIATMSLRIDVKIARNPNGDARGGGHGDCLISLARVFSRRWRDAVCAGTLSRCLAIIRQSVVRTCQVRPRYMTMREDLR